MTTWLHALLREETPDATQPDSPADENQVSPGVPEGTWTSGEGASDSAAVDDTTAAAADAKPLPVFAPASLPSGDPIQFYEFRSASTLTQHLALAVEAEGPLLETVLFRRVARAWGLERTGSRIVKRLKNLVPKDVQRTSAGGNTFYWPKDTQPTTWAECRVCKHNEASRRHTDEVCLEELSGLALHVLRHAGASPRPDIARAVCRLLGMARTPAESEARVNAAVDRLVALGKALDLEGSIRARP